MPHVDVFEIGPEFGMPLEEVLVKKRGQSVPIRQYFLQAVVNRHGF
jgi:hypothetical protein